MICPSTRVLLPLGWANHLLGELRLPLCGNVNNIYETAISETVVPKMTEKFVAKNSYFIYEGKNMLIEEFGKDYVRYFEILQLIATGHTTRSEIEDVMKVELSGYLTKLENDYCLISRYVPLFQKTNRNIRSSRPLENSRNIT